MHPASTDKPTQAQLVLPLMEAIRDLGGRARPKDVAALLAERFNVGQQVLSETVKMPRGASDRQDEQYVALWPRHVRFAREKAKAMGYAVSGGHGIWQLSDEAPLALRRVVPAVSVTFYVDDEGAPVSAQIRLEGVLPTIHTIQQGDARDLSWLPDSSIQLAVTSCPYFDLKAYEEAPGQMADAENYETFLEMLEVAWAELYRVLEPGGNALINVGDVARYENAGTGAFLGKPNQPGGIIKSDNEYILRFRKPGAYRKPTADQARLSHIPMDECQKLFRSVWDDVPGARATGEHPASYPVEIPGRLIRMFSFVGDTVPLRDE